MTDIAIDTREAADALLTALADQLGAIGVRYELVVIGGTALLALGLVSRATRDVDLVGLKESEGITPADPLPERLYRRDYGPALTVFFASRIDQIHLKLYALVDQGPGKHEDDLRALAPTRDELLAAGRWSRTHDPSQGYRSMLVRALAHLGVEDADVGD